MISVRSKGTKPLLPRLFEPVSIYMNAELIGGKLLRCSQFGSW